MPYIWLKPRLPKEALVLKTCQKTTLIIMATGLMALPSAAQDAGQIEIVEPIKKRVRIVEPIPMWVESERLRVRDNPYAGDVVGLLKVGQKIKVYDRTDNWIRISANGKPAKWINSDFLSTSRVTWSNYEFGSIGRSTRGTPSDISKKRIKIKELKDMKVYAAHKKPSPNGGHVIITRHDFRTGPYYEKRLVQCDAENAASHVRMLGEGYNYLMMEKDPRGEAVSEPVSADDSISESTSPLNRAIAEFTCKVKNI